MILYTNLHYFLCEGWVRAHVKSCMPLIDGNLRKIAYTYVTSHHQMRHKSHSKVLSKWLNKEK